MSQFNIPGLSLNSAGNIDAITHKPKAQVVYRANVPHDSGP